MKFNNALREYLSKPEVKSRLTEKSQHRLDKKNVMSILDTKDVQDIKVLSECPIRIKDFWSEASKKNHEEIKDTLKKLNIDFTENPTLVRGIEYYNDLCFEIKYAGEKGMTKDTLLGGGRYDFLFNQLQGKEYTKSQIPAIGYTDW
jgi:histidyl-tRNA synthetase